MNRASLILAVSLWYVGSLQTAANVMVPAAQYLKQRKHIQERLQQARLPDVLIKIIFEYLRSNLYTLYRTVEIPLRIEPKGASFTEACLCLRDTTARWHVWNCAQDAMTDPNHSASNPITISKTTICASSSQNNFALYDSRNHLLTLWDRHSPPRLPIQGKVAGVTGIGYWKNKLIVSFWDKHTSESQTTLMEVWNSKDRKAQRRPVLLPHKLDRIPEFTLLPHDTTATLLIGCTIYQLQKSDTKKNKTFSLVPLQILYNISVTSSSTHQHREQTTPVATAANTRYLLCVFPGNTPKSSKLDFWKHASFAEITEQHYNASKDFGMGNKTSSCVVQ